MNIIATFCEYQTALVAVGKTTEWVQLTDTFCEYQIALVFVGEMRKYAKLVLFVNIRLRL